MTGSFLLRPLALAATLAVAGPALAQADAPLPPGPPPVPAPGSQAATPVPLAYGISQKFTHESNLFRETQGAEDDWVSTTALNLALDQPLGRGKLRGTASLQANRYGDHDELDNTGHDVDLALDIETALNLAGTVGVRASRQQYRYGLDSATPFDGKNIEDEQAAYVQARLGGMGVWSLLAGADTLERSYSQDAFAALNDLSQWSAEGGVGWRPGPDLGGTLKARYTRISRPDSPLGFGDDVGRREVELAMGWQASGASRLEGRVARAKERHSVLDDRSFWTGGLAWDWTPGAKLRLRTELSRDTEGAGGAQISPEPGAQAVPAGDTLRDSLRWSVEWAATAKVNVLAAAQYAERRLKALVGGLPASAEDQTTALSLGVRWAPSRALDLGCDLAREKRETDSPLTVITRAYELTTVGCSVAFWFR